MKTVFLIFSFLLFGSPVFADEMIIRVNVNRVCSKVVRILYASDTFSDESWQRFKQCIHFMKKFDGIK